MTLRTRVHLTCEVALALPLERYRIAFGERRGTFLLEDRAGDSGAPFALLGAEPIATFRATRTAARSVDGRALARVTILDERGLASAVADDPLAALGDLLAAHALVADAPRDLTLPLLGGAVGYFGYELGQMLERLPGAARRGPRMPDVAFSLHRWVLGVRRADGRALLSVLGRGASDGDARRDAETTRDAVLRRLREVERGAARGASDTSEPPPALADLDRLAAAANARATLDRAAYAERVVRAKRHIASGDAFEICLTSTFEAPFRGDPFRLFAELRRSNPAPFAAFLDLPEGAVVSSSPECFLRVERSGIVESRPIKGTRPRALGDADARLSRELASSEKDRAENMMIVDLVRNDLGRVCRFGSVEVPSLCAVESYATVHQLVSTVRGRLADGRSAIDVVRAAFPPGSMTGAPKIEAMAILEGLEPCERGVYSGALGFIDTTGAMDLSVVIRTAVVASGRVWIGAGGAIVADSDPVAEHEEAWQKARVLLAAVARTQGEPREGAPAMRRETS
jgi:para-aminobenzoate synthetase component I